MKIIAQRKSEWPKLVTVENEVMVWCSPVSVTEYFHFNGKNDVYRLLSNPNSDKYRAHHGGIQLRYSRDGLNPTRPFTNPQKFQVRKGKAL